MQKKGSQMEKLILSNGQEFDLIIPGVTVNTANKKRSFKLTTELTYEEIKAIFSDSSNLVSIDHVLSNGAKLNYVDCTEYKGLGFEPSHDLDGVTIPDIYTIDVSTDKSESRIKVLEKELKEQKEINSSVDTSFEELMIEI
mgnify:CR=1 FL=1